MYMELINIFIFEQVFINMLEVHVDFFFNLQINLLV